MKYLAVAVSVPLVAAALLIGLAGGTATSTASGFGYDPSALAVSDIPPEYLIIYRAAGDQYGLDWSILAAIGKKETDHGRLNAPGVKSGVNTYGCCAGPMQFSITPKPSTWDTYGNGGSVYDPADAIPAAARYLKASGAPGNYRQAIFAYNHADWYVADVLSQAEKYRGALRAAQQGGQNISAGMTPKQVIDNVILPMAAQAGIPITAAAVEAANARHGPTNSGGLSDHQGPPEQRWAADISNGFAPTPEMDKLAMVITQRFGLPPLDMNTTGAAGSAQTSSGIVQGFRFQVIYRSYTGGNHDNHVHVGVSRA